MAVDAACGTVGIGMTIAGGRANKNLLVQRARWPSPPSRHSAYMTILIRPNFRQWRRYLTPSPSTFFRPRHGKGRVFARCAVRLTGNAGKSALFAAAMGSGRGHRAIGSRVRLLLLRASGEQIVGGDLDCWSRPVGTFRVTSVLQKNPDTLEMTISNQLPDHESLICRSTAWLVGEQPLAL